MRGFLRASAASVYVAIVGPKDKYATFVPSGDFVIENAPPRGPSIGIVLKGYWFPTSGDYEVTLLVRDANDAPIATVQLNTLRFLPSRDLILRFAPYFESAINFFPQPDWETDVDVTMKFLGAILPVRDTVQRSLNSNRWAGLRYLYDSGHPVDWTQGFDSFLGPTLAIDQLSMLSGKTDRIDTSVLFRRTVPGEGPNGNSPYGPWQYQGVEVRTANPICGSGAAADGTFVDFTGTVCAHEIGHSLGLEPANSPFFNGSDHSTESHVFDDPYGYNFFLGAPYRYDPMFMGRWGRGVGDMMLTGWFEGPQAAVYNWFDWEALRQTLLADTVPSSTGTDINPYKWSDATRKVPLAPSRFPVPLYYDPNDPGPVLRGDSVLIMGGQSIITELRTLGVDGLCLPNSDRMLPPNLAAFASRLSERRPVRNTANPQSLEALGARPPSRAIAGFSADGRGSTVEASSELSTAAAGPWNRSSPKARESFGACLCGLPSATKHECPYQR